jgi:hypothetical protein
MKGGQPLAGRPSTPFLRGLLGLAHPVDVSCASGGWGFSRSEPPARPPWRSLESKRRRRGRCPACFFVNLAAGESCPAARSQSSGFPELLFWGAICRLWNLMRSKLAGPNALAPRQPCGLRRLRAVVVAPRRGQREMERCSVRQDPGEWKPFAPTRRRIFCNALRRLAGC